MKRFTFITGFVFAVLLLTSHCSCQSPSQVKTELHQKVDSVLSLMTLEEKIGQMTLFTSDWDQTGPTMRENYKQDIRSGKAGAIFNAHTAAYNRGLQKIAVEETRLGIPLIFGYDVIHGYKTIFPMPLAEACSWDMPAIEKSARISAEEATASGLHWTFAPMIDISRDPRWGRIMESPGEDPYLGQAFAKAKVRGFEGNDLSAHNTMVACAKHYIAYGAAQAGRDYHTVDISDRTLHEIYLPPFKAAIDAGVGSVMTSFNELNGVPVTGSHYLLTEILRNELDFEGFVVTDYTGVWEMIQHGVVANDKEAGELAVNAGVDMDMQSAAFYKFLRTSVEEGKVKEEQIDRSVRYILQKKFELGLFDDPYKYSNEEREKEEILAEDHMTFARDFARKSMVLLKNDQNILPLSKKTKTIALVGPFADNKSDLLGAWHAAGFAEDCISLFEGLKNKVGASTEIIYAKGCDIIGNSSSDQDFIKAREAAMKADLIVVAIGEAEWMSGEAASRSQIRLPDPQLELVKAMVQTGKPVVAVLINGRPLVLPWIYENVPAILEAWHPGTQGGNAIADILFGDYNPSGKLTVTFPRNEGQIPIFYSMKNNGRPMNPNSRYTSKYLDIPNSPQYSFGFGLSYTTFKYSDLKVDKTSFGMDEKVTIDITITNTGKYGGEEVVQLYVRDLIGSVTRPVKELKGFKKIFLETEESQTLQFTLTKDDLAFFTKDMTYAAEPGDFQIFIGGNSDTTYSVRVRLTE